MAAFHPNETSAFNPSQTFSRNVILAVDLAAESNVGAARAFPIPADQIHAECAQCPLDSVANGRVGIGAASQAHV